jgi:topoisomerase-4 subunit A
LRLTEKRKHIVLGFLKMVSILDQVIKLIRESLGKKDAIKKIVEAFGFTELQADAIVSLQLYRLSTTDVTEMRKESNDLSKTISRLERILSNEIELEKAVVEELEEILNKYPVERKTEISGQIQKVEIDEQELIENENVIFVISKDGYIKRSSLKSYSASQSETGLKEGDMVLKKTEVNTRNTLLFFTNFGNFINLPVYKIPDLKWKDMGDYIGNYAQLIDKERVIDYLVINDFDESKDVLVANQEGQIKRIPLIEFQKTRINRTFNVLPANRINQLVSVDLKEDFDLDVVLVSENGYVLRYAADEIPLQSLNARGVKGINLRDDALVGAKYSTRINKDELLMLTNRGGLKREFIANIDLSHRPAKGKRYLKTVKTNPYKIIGVEVENIFRMKENLRVRFLAKKNALTIEGKDLMPDKYENGIPILDRSDLPFGLVIEIDNYHDSKEILMSLYEKIDLEEIDDSQETDEVMNELEKIISNSKDLEVDEVDDESKDDDLDDDIIQQTLF